MEGSAIDPVSLQEVFALVPEVRQARGRRHPLLSILNRTAVTILADRKCLEAIAQFARDHGPELARKLGFTHWPTPCKATLSNFAAATRRFTAPPQEAFPHVTGEYPEN